MSQQLRGALTGMLGVGLAAIVAVAGCSPLPGRTLDPVYLRIGPKSGEEAPPTAPAQPQAGQAGQAARAPQVGLPPPASPPPQAFLPAPGSSLATGPPTGASVWVGRYRDNRGEGDITFSIVRGETTVSGTWKLRTGGGGPIAGIVEAERQRFQLRMENIASECPAQFEGSAEFRGTSLVGTYQGRDCEGPVSKGSFELHAK